MGIFLSINLYIKMIGLATSFAERQNLTMHMQMLRFTRSTNAFSKKFEHYGYMVAIYAVFYNWLRVHKTLRGTPAMAAGLTDRLWSWEELVAMVDEEAPKAGRPAKYRTKARQISN